MLACLAAVLGTCWWKLDYGLGVVCIYMAAAQAVAIDTSGPADLFFLRCPQPTAADTPGPADDPSRLRFVFLDLTPVDSLTKDLTWFSSAVWTIRRASASPCTASGARSSQRRSTSPSLVRLSIPLPPVVHENSEPGDHDNWTPNSFI